MAKYVKKPIVIDAFLLGEMAPDWFMNAVASGVVTLHRIPFHESRVNNYGQLWCEIKTLEGVMVAHEGKDYVIKGVDGELYPCKRDIFEKTYENQVDRKDIVINILKELGTPCHITGWDLIIEAVSLMLNDDKYGQVTKQLYPRLAEITQSTPQRVERNIRHAIEVTFNFASPDIIEKYFGNSISYEKGKANNAHFLKPSSNTLCYRIKIYRLRGVR